MHDINTKEGRINAFFEFNVPCYFNECEQLRNEYLAELSELEKSGGCNKCNKNALIGKYVRKILPLV